jgi:uncharacterized membrane protein
VFEIKQFIDRKLILILIVIALIYITIISYFSYLRFTNFFTSNWDMGIGMQSLWTNTHGYLLYESGDYEGYGVLSYFQVHSTYVAILFSYLYAIYSSPLTLFVMQAVFISLSIIPLYYISRKAGLSPTLIIFIVLLFLLNFSIISGLLYDFHWESLIPVEFFSLFFLVLEKRYYQSLAVFAVGCMTLEIFPFLIVGIVFYFFITKYLRGNKNSSLWSEIPNKILMIFLLTAIISYFIIRVAQYYIIPDIVHQTPYYAGLAESSNSLLSLHINIGNISLSLLYWLMIFISLGMLPLLAPKLLLTAAPWVFYTFLITTGFTTGFGNQDSLLTTPYAMLATIGGMEYLLNNRKNTFVKVLGLSISFSAVFLLIPVFGKSLSYDILSMRLPGFYYSLIPVAVIVSAFIIWRKKQNIKTKSVLRYLAIFTCSLIAMNLVLSPVNVENFQATPLPGYSFTYTVNPEFQYATEIAKLIPKNATVIASDNLFPLIANSRNAYSLAWVPYSNGIIKYLPFNDSSLPDYIFIDQSSFYLPEFLNSASTNYTKYGLYAYTYSNEFPGSIGLYKLNYKLVPVFIGVQVPKVQIFNESNLDIGSGGSIVRCDSTISGKAIYGKTSNDRNLTIWYGPYTTLSPGNYTLNVSFKIIENRTTSYPENVLDLSGWVYHGITIFNKNITLTSGMNGVWESVKIKFTVDTLILNAQFSGTLYSSANKTLSIYLNDMILVAT